MPLDVGPWLLSNLQQRCAKYLHEQRHLLSPRRGGTHVDTVPCVRVSGETAADRAAVAVTSQARSLVVASDALFAS